jgi:hypothetical protein
VRRALVGFLAVGALAAPAVAAGARVDPPPDGRWQYQLQAIAKGGFDTGRIDVGICGRPRGGGRCLRPMVYDFDLYRDGRGGAVDRHPNRRGVRAVHASGGYAICYVDAGGIENYRPDFARFKRWNRSHGRSLLGKPFSKRFPDERWANVGGKAQRRFLLRMMDRRTAKCARAGFDAVEYDVVAAHESGRKVTGWKVSYRDQLAYNRGLARIAHHRGLAVGLKNDLSQVKDLVRDFDFAINEECFTYDECELLTPFVEAAKPVFHVEYTNSRGEFCATTEALGFNSIRKGANFGLRPLPYKPCS